MSRTRRLLASLVVCTAVWALPTAAHADDDAAYTVRPGDSIYGIAAKFEIRVGTLTAANGLTVASVILPGQQLTIPGGAATSPSAPAPAPAPAPAAVATSGASYTVVSGDSLYGIARRHGASLSSLLAANGLSVSSLILPGMQLQLPAGAAAPAPTPAPTAAPAPAPVASSGASYAVVSGDSLYGIARRHGSSLTALLAVNGLSVSSLILPGMQLQLPANASTPAAPAAEAPVAPSTVGSRVDQVVRFALDQRGKSYGFFTRGPDSYDCSGLTVAAYAQVGIDLVHYSAAQAKQGRAVDLTSESIRPGDLIFMKRRGSDTINHVGMAIDGRRWIHAPGTGVGVTVAAMPATSSIDTVRRYIES